MSVHSSSSELTLTDNMAPGLPAYYSGEINHKKQLYPHCIVWTPIPLLTWLFPFIGHMGIATTLGIIRDFAGPYFVSESNMAFGKPTKYWQLDLSKVPSNSPNEVWDRGVYEASEVYKGRMHNLCCDNCHSHVAMALNEMNYSNSNSWNMFKLTLFICLNGKFVSCGAFLKTYLPFIIIMSAVIILVCCFKFI